MDMKCDWESKPGISTFLCVKILEIREESFLVRQMMILGKLVINATVLSSDWKGGSFIYR